LYIDNLQENQVYRYNYSQYGLNRLQNICRYILVLQNIQYQTAVVNRTNIEIYKIV